MEEFVIFEDSENYVTVTNNFGYYVNALCNRLVIYQSLFEIRIFASLNGHSIIDTGKKPKIDGWKWKID